MGNIKKARAPKNRQTKINLVFDETARQEYLTGFRKRKNERRKKATEEKQQQLKDEKKEFKKQRRELLKKSFHYTGKSKQGLPDVSDILEPEVHDLPQHTVTITDISEIDMVGHTGLRLGQNTFEDKDEESAADKSSEEPESVAVLKKKLKDLNRKQIAKSVETERQKKHKKPGFLKQKKKMFNPRKDKDRKSRKRHKEKKDRRKIKKRN